MILKKLLLVATSLATVTLLVACQSGTKSKNITDTAVSKSSNQEKEKSDTVDKEIQVRLKKLYENVPETAGSNYNTEITEQSEKAWNSQQANIFLGQSSLTVVDDYLPKELTKLKVEIDGYDSATRRLKLSVTNNYEQTLLGATQDTNGRYTYGTYFTLYGYSTLSGKAVRIKIMQLALTEDLKAGETVRLEVLSPGHYNSQADYSEKYKNEELDSKYVLVSSDYYKGLWDTTLDQVIGQEIVDEQVVLSSLANIYIVPKLIFEQYPTSLDDTEVKEILSQYNYS